MSQNLMNRRTVREGTVLFNQGDPGRDAYIVQKGTVEIFITKDGHESVLGYVREGAMFGEMALIDNKPRMAGARAKDHCVLIVIPGDKFINEMDAASGFLRGVIKVLLGTVRDSGSRVAAIETKMVQQQRILNQMNKRIKQQELELQQLKQGRY